MRFLYIKIKENDADRPGTHNDEPGDERSATNTNPAVVVDVTGRGLPPQRITANARAQHDAHFLARGADVATSNANAPVNDMNKFSSLVKPITAEELADADIIPLTAEERLQVEVESRRDIRGFVCHICQYETTLPHILRAHMRREHYEWWLKESCNIEYVHTLFGERNSLLTRAACSP